MCGIAGGFAQISSPEQAGALKKNLSIILKLSSLRGQDSAGLELFFEDRSELVTANTSARKLVKSTKFQNLKFYNPASASASFLLHCRLATSGSLQLEENNQPMKWPVFSAVHNGIVTEIDGQFVGSGPQSTYSDSYHLFESLQKKLLNKSNEPESVLQNMLQNISGEANVALYFPTENKFILATNTGSIFFVLDKNNKLFYFMSERHLLNQFLKKAQKLPDETRALKVQQLKPGYILSFSTENFSTDISNFSPAVRSLPQPVSEQMSADTYTPIQDLPRLKRCSRCILPETYPFIKFDEHGICNFCHRYERQIQRGEGALLKFLEPFRSRNGEADCLVGLSGGRDSCYGLHLLKTKYGMNPIAYTFDWGLTTDTSRRNQSLLCGQLGIEHIIRSAHISQKRSYIQKNIEAFLKRPHMGMVPLFMSGDKEFYEYGRTLRDELEVGLTVFCAGHSLEQRDFFTGFCGVDENIANNKRLFHFSIENKVKLALFYASQYALNPAYINGSFFESVRSFFYSFIYRDDFLYLYEYVPWNESEIEKTLASYKWEADKAYGQNQWRMGDGQTAFTNYIYRAVAGFTEFDNYRSNQIREGMLSRDEAIKALTDDNRPKHESLKYFAEVVGIDLDSVLKKIDQIPKLYSS